MRISVAKTRLLFCHTVGEAGWPDLQGSSLSSDKMLLACDSGKCGSSGRARWDAGQSPQHKIRFAPDERLRRLRIKPLAKKLFQ